MTLVVRDDKLQVNSGEGRNRRAAKNIRRPVSGRLGQDVDGQSVTMRADHALGETERDGTRWEVSHGCGSWGSSQGVQQKLP